MTTVGGIPTVLAEAAARGPLEELLEGRVLDAPERAGDGSVRYP